jgi:hypothetical protein
VGVVVLELEIAVEPRPAARPAAAAVG